MEKMEIALISPTAIKLKGKQASFVVDPIVTRAKQQADAAFITGGVADTDASGIEGSRVTFSGPGDYEVGGIKISGVRSNGRVVYYLSLDGITIMVGAASSVKGKEMREAQVVALLADELIDQSALATMNASAVLFYGEKAAENITALGKTAEGIAKYVTTRDKLPTEMEVILLS